MNQKRNTTLKTHLLTLSLLPKTAYNKFQALEQPLTQTVWQVIPSLLTFKPSMMQFHSTFSETVWWAMATRTRQFKSMSKRSRQLKSRFQTSSTATACQLYQKKKVKSCLLQGLNRQGRTTKPSLTSCRLWNDIPPMVRLSIWFRTLRKRYRRRNLISKMSSLKQQGSRLIKRETQLAHYPSWEKVLQP